MKKQTATTSSSKHSRAAAEAVGLQTKPSQVVTTTSSRTQAVGSLAQPTQVEATTSSLVKTEILIVRPSGLVRYLDVLENPAVTEVLAEIFGEQPRPGYGMVQPNSLRKEEDEFCHAFAGKPIAWIGTCCEGTPANNGLFHRRPVTLLGAS